jgi:hypothetical protein
MRKRLAFLAVILVTATAVLAAGTHTARADDRDFMLYNNSHVNAIVHFYVSPSSSDDWGDDVLGLDILPPDSNVFIYFKRYQPGLCLYDLRVVFDDGGVVNSYDQDLCANDSFAFH